MPTVASSLASVPGPAFATPAASTDSRWSVASIYAVFFACLGLIYVPVLITLGKDWAIDANYSHGFVVPFAVAYIVWHQRAQLRALPARPSQWGLALAALSQVEFLVGRLGAEFFLQRTSLLLLIVGAIVYLYGWAHLRLQLFSLALLLLAIPLPAIIFNAIAFPLQLLASAWASALLNLCSIPVFREGNILVLPQRTLDVAEACSGIRSLFSLITLAMLVAWFMPARFWRRALLVASAVPFALLANALRIALSALIGQWFGEQYSEGFFHAFAGWLVFLFAFALLLLLASLLSGRRAPGPAQ